jgi:hypothetical protein
MLKLIDLLRLSGVGLANFKIHCATDNKRSTWRPLQAYLAGEFEHGQSCQSQKNFECEHIVSLINLADGEHWLFAGVYRVLGVRRGNPYDRNGFYYETKALGGLDHLAGRAIIKFAKTFRASYLTGAKYANQLIVAAIREQRMTIGGFPGFNRVLLPFSMLQALIREANPSWRAALGNISGVYLVVDNSTGKQYVDSAYGGVGIWQRWVAYAKTGHGGNKELRELLRSRGERHARNFQFALLEMCDINASTDYICKRESHWKEVLRSREFGLNWN